jgi:hypothetical protein
MNGLYGNIEYCIMEVAMSEKARLRLGGTMTEEGEALTEAERQAMIKVLDQRIARIRERLEEIKRLKEAEPMWQRKLSEYLSVRADLLGEGEKIVAPGDQGDLSSLSFPEACLRIFLERASSRQRLTVRQLVEILESRGKKFTSKNPIATLSSKLSRDRRFSYVIEHGQYLWGLAEWGTEKGEVIEQSRETEEQPSVS